MPPKKGQECFIKFDALEGKQIDSRDYKDGYVLIDIWATWCGPCVKSIPALGKLYSQYKTKGFMLLGISCDEDETKVKTFMAEKHVNWPIHFDGNGPDNKIAVELGISAVPVLILVGPGGKVINPNITTAQLSKYLEKTLGDPATQDSAEDDTKISPHSELLAASSDGGQGGGSSSKNLGRSKSFATLRIEAAEGNLVRLAKDQRSYPLTRDAFTLFLQNQFCEEQFLFLVDYYDLFGAEGVTDSTDGDESDGTNGAKDMMILREKLESLNKKYIDPSGELSVNISGVQRKKCLADFMAAKTYQDYVDTYASVARECKNLIIQGNYVESFIQLNSQNITTAEKTNRVWVAGVFFTLALALVAALIFTNQSRWARLSALPFLVISSGYYESGRHGV
jgi:thiol-disulfide isomerase/thioredoxin